MNFVSYNLGIEKSALNKFLDLLNFRNKMMRSRIMKELQYALRLLQTKYALYLQNIIVIL